MYLQDVVFMQEHLDSQLQKVQTFSSGSFEKVSLSLDIRLCFVNNKLGDIPSNGTIKPMIYCSGYSVVNSLDHVD
jgi:hypothetical protein